jgi:PAS domain-containing protein
MLMDERLLLAMESGKAVGWEWDSKTGRDSWFGDLESMFGIASENFFVSPEDFYRCVHPKDRKQVSDAIADAKKSHKSYAAEFPVLWPDGTLRWVAAMGRYRRKLDPPAERSRRGGTHGQLLRT